MQPVVTASSEFISYGDFYRNSAYAEFDQEHRSGGSFGVEMIEVAQEGHEFTDPALPQLSIVGVCDAKGGAELDFRGRLEDGTSCARWDFRPTAHEPRVPI